GSGHPITRFKARFAIAAKRRLLQAAAEFVSRLALCNQSGGVVAPSALTRGTDAPPGRFCLALSAGAFSPATSCGIATRPQSFDVIVADKLNKSIESAIKRLVNTCRSIA